jgi:competence transcription factor ComK
MIKFIDGKDGTDIWISERAILQLTRVGNDHTQIHTINMSIIVLGTAENTVEKIDGERWRFHGN